MSLKVISTHVPEKFNFGPANKKNIRSVTSNFKFYAVCDIDGERGKLWFFCDIGMLYNGASNPLQWPIKNFYGEDKKDCCGLGHDLLYAFGGRVVNLSKELDAGECDDYIRGAMREAGFSRKSAGIVDWAVRHFAHLRHFGTKHDKEGMHLHSKITWTPGEI